MGREGDEGGGVGGCDLVGVVMRDIGRFSFTFGTHGPTSILSYQHRKAVASIASNGSMGRMLRYKVIQHVVPLFLTTY
jgi:hypothetical protein